MNNPYSYMPQEQNMFVAMVNGESGAYFYPVAPNNTGFLFDFNQNKFWVKSVQRNGLPEPMHSFSFEEDSPPKEEDKSDIYATKEDVSEIKEMLKKFMEEKHESSPE